MSSCAPFFASVAGNADNWPRSIVFPGPSDPTRPGVKATRTSKALSSTALPWLAEAVKGPSPKAVVTVNPRLSVPWLHWIPFGAFNPSLRSDSESVVVSKDSVSLAPTRLAKIRPTSTSRSSWWVSSMHRTIGRSKLSCFWSFLKSKILDNQCANSGYDSGFWCQYDDELAAGLRALEAEICYQMVNDDCACT